MRLRALLLPLLAAVVVAVVGAASANSRPSAPTGHPGAGAAVVAAGKSATIKIANFAFHPAALTVRVGTEITVTNTDQTQHTLTASAGAFDTGTLQPGKSRTITVTKPGVFAYYCQFHAFMTGTLKVVK